MLLFVGLGNPTPDSENNRHNVGFKIIDSINKKFSLSKQKPKFKGLLTTGNIENKKIYAIKPLTFMNNSGICIRELIEYFKIDAENVIVFHDDLDVEFGKIKAKFGGSSAGHNGIASIDKFIGKEKIYAIKPLTFMNNSGICIRELIEYFKIDVENVIVFHDDLDVEFGKIKAKFGGSSAGHNGIASIDKFIGKDYSRVRIGIGKPKENIEVGDFVLQNFEEEELAGIEKISNHINESISILVEKKLDLFSSTVNNNK